MGAKPLFENLRRHHKLIALYLDEYYTFQAFGQLTRLMLERPLTATLAPQYEAKSF